MADTTSILYQVGQAVKTAGESGGSSSGIVLTTNNTSLNSDTRNTRGVTRLYRREDNSDYSVQTDWTGQKWRLRGYVGDSLHAECQVQYAEYAVNAGTLDSLDSTHFLNYNNLTNKPSIPTVSTASQRIQNATGNYGSVKVTAKTGGWAGYAIQDDWVFMSASEATCGIYNDTNNEWATIWRQNGATELFHDGNKRLDTTSGGIVVTGGVSVEGTASAGGEVSAVGKGRFGGWDTYTAFSGAATEIGVSSGDGWILPYNRGTSSYLPSMNIQCGAKIKLYRDTKRTDITGLTAFGPADQTYTTMSISPGPASAGATSYISTNNSNNMGFRTGGSNLGMEITDSGAYVRTPNNPFVLAKKTVHATASGPIVCDSILNQRSNSYSTSTGYFTAPVEGRYVCSITVLPYSFNTSNTSTIQWYRNGSYYVFGGMYTRMYGSYFGQGNTLTIYLSQGDYIYPYFARSGSCGLHSNYTTLSINYTG